jgi:hypothetical protein
MTDPGWRRYLDEFHAEHAGITERVLCRARDRDGRDPYGWLASAVPPDAAVVDVAYGSAPLCARLGNRYVGLDRSAEELAIARRRCPGRPVRPGRRGAPHPDRRRNRRRSGLLDGAADPAAARGDRRGAPAGRVARRDDAGHAGPDPARQGEVAAVVAALKGPLPSGNDQRELPTLLARAGLQLTEDASWRFALPIRTHEDAKELVESVYLPGFGATEIARASAVAARWREAAMSIRRLVAHRPA